MADDDDLRARLEALKKPCGASRAGQPPKDDSDELVNRFLRFRSSSPSLEHRNEHQEDVSEDHKSLKELLADIPSTKDWNVDPSDEKNIEKLLREAQKMLPDEEKEDSPSNLHDQAESHHPSVEGDTEAQGSSKDTNEDAEADEALQQILDELEGEDSFLASDVADPKPEEPSQAKQDSPEADIDTHPSLELPSAPSAEPLQSTQESDVDNPDLSGLVDLPSAPTVKPSAKGMKTQSSLPVYTNEEIDSWCVICNEDATVRCIGCEGDLYCASCWKEGHMTADAGLEERQHRWTKYRRDKKT